MKSSFSTKTISLCAMMAALASAIMLTGGLVPVFTYCSPLLASLCLIPVLDRCGKKAAWATWAVAAGISLLIGADKEASFFWVFFGWYPIVKPRLDAVSRPPLRLLCKVLLFLFSGAVMYGLTCFVLGIDEILSSFSGSAVLNALFLLAIALCMLLFDRALVNMTALYRKRFASKSTRN